MTHPPPWSPASAPDADTGPAWGQLERLFEAFAANERANPMPAALKSARETLPAAAVYLDPGDTGDAWEVAGPPALTPAACRALTRVLTADSPAHEREILYTAPPGLPPAVPGTNLAVAGAALVCLSRSKQVWLVAANFAPGRAFSRGDVRLLSFVRRMVANHLRHEKSKDELKGTLLGLIHCLSSAIDAKDSYTAGHSERVARMAVRLAEQMRLPQAVRSDLYLAGLLHDVGKIGVSDVVLRKPGPLTDAEFAEVRRHPEIGEKIVSQVKQLRHLCPGVRWHHERHDGTGYPDKLAGTAIPLLARVLAVADSVDAMTSARPYRALIPAAKVEEILRAGANRQWDGEVVEAFFGCMSDLYTICSRGLGESVAQALTDRPGAGHSHPVAHSVQFRDPA